MEYVLYHLATDSAMHITIAYEVDCFFWNQKGIATRCIAATRSMGYAMWMMACSEKRGTERVRSGPALSGSEWNELREEAGRTGSLLKGRALLWSELTSFMKKNGLEHSARRLAQVIQYIYLHQGVTWDAGVYLGERSPTSRCNRCRAPNTSIVEMDCATCDEKCAMCEQCFLLGRSRRCDLFLLFRREDLHIPLVFSSPQLELTESQRRVSVDVNQFLHTDKEQYLVWAVTGAGKTEMLVPSVEKVLLTGRKVLWVTPRRDVVMEIAPRMHQFFSEVRCIALYGGSEDLWRRGDLVVATAQQASRYYQYFDLAIVDEVDAFPLYGNKCLAEGIQRALSPHGKQIYLTATPPENWKKHMARSSSMAVLSCRYHGNPLPVPRLIREKSLEMKIKKHLSIPVITEFLHKVSACKGQVFIFVPRTRDIQSVLGWLSTHWNDTARVAGVHSQDPERKEKVRQFREGILDILVTTTILERGVTVPRCFVLVLEADHPVFCHRSLIQIAGRVGRSGHYQQGEVWFIGNERTEGQRRARRETEWLNQKSGGDQQYSFFHAIKKYMNDVWNA